MPLDRGPWDNATAFLLAGARNEQTVLARQSSSMNQYRRKPTHDAAFYSKLLSMYMAAVPHIAPSTNESICAPTLRHPDLNQDIILVAASGPGYWKSLINWQSAATLPYFMRLYIPPAVTYQGNKIDTSPDNLFPELPPNFDRLNAEEQEECLLYLRFANRERWCQSKLSRIGHRKMVTSLPHMDQLAMIPGYVTRAWVDGVSDLREGLVKLRDNWSDIAGPGVPCPIEFSEEEMAEHREEWEKAQCYRRAVEAMEEQLGCLDDGWVAHENYDFAKREIGGVEKSWDERATGSPFPFKDGEYSFFLS